MNVKSVSVLLWGVNQEIRLSSLPIDSVKIRMLTDNKDQLHFQLCPQTSSVKWECLQEHTLKLRWLRQIKAAVCIVL